MGRTLSSHAVFALSFWVGFRMGEDLTGCWIPSRASRLACMRVHCFSEAPAAAPDAFVGVAANKHHISILARQRLQAGADSA